MNEKFVIGHFVSHNVVNATKCDELVKLVTNDIDEGRHKTGYDVEIEKGSPMVKGSLLVKDLVDKMNNKSNVIIQVSQVMP